MVSLVITIFIISLSIMPLLSARSSSAPHHRTSMEPPHSQFPPRKLGPLEGSVPIARDGSSMSQTEEEWRKDTVDSTVDRYASQEKKLTTTGRRMTTAAIHRQAGAVKDNKRRGTRTMMVEESSSNNNPQSRRYYKYYFTMDYSGVRRRRPIHNKSIPSSTTSSSAITPP